MSPKPSRCSLILPLVLASLLDCACFAADRTSTGSAVERQSENLGPVGNETDPRSSVRLSRQELDLLNEKLRRAMALYYDQSYRLALPILQEIASQVDTMDILYWLGHAAARSGDLDLAIDQFNRMLQRNPELPQARLELAGVYLQKGDSAAARAELGSVLAANPPESLRRQIDDVLAGIDLSQKRFFATVRASVGLTYDDNVNVGPKDDTIILPGGLATLTTKKLKGWMVSSNANVDLLYDFGGKDGFVWRNTVYIQDNTYADPENRSFNYTQSDARTGLEYYAPQFRARLPVGFVDRQFANRRLSQSLYLAPSVEVNMTESVDVTLGYRYEDESYHAEATEGQSNVTQTGTFGPRYRTKTANALHFVSFLGSYSERDADASRFSYRDWSIGPAYFVRFDKGIEVYLDARYLERDYRAPAFLFESLGDRHDTRYTATVAVSRTFYKNFFVSANYAYIRNDSNVPLYRYSKSLGGVNVGVNLNF